jgi:hypothetical protein
MQTVETTTSSPNSINAVLAAVKYGQSSTYPFELDKEKLEWLSDKVNRSRGQTLFLFQMVGGDFEKLKALEVQIKNCFVSYCPADVEEVEKVMALVSKSNWFTLSD